MHHIGRGEIELIIKLKSSSQTDELQDFAGFIHINFLS